MLSITVGFLAALAAASAIPKRSDSGCGNTLPDGQSAGAVSTVNLGDRSFLISIPPSYNTSTQTPAILSYHGADRTAQDQLDLDRLTDTTFNSATFVIYPESDGDYWQGSPGATADDVGFTNDIINYIQSTYCIDASRIFATGKSEGGGFCGVLACDSALSSLIAAFAPVSGAFYIATDNCNPDLVAIPCQASRTNIPFLEFHGGDDQTINYGGGTRKDECLPSIPHYISQWAVRDGLGDTNVSTPISSDTILYEFGQGSQAGMVQQVYDSSIGHDWPSTSANADNSRDGHEPASFDATPIILSFFNNHPLAS